MSRWLTFGGAEYAGKRKPTRRGRLLAEMDRVVPWAELAAVIAPHWPNGERERPSFLCETRLRRSSATTRCATGDFKSTSACCRCW